MAVARKLAVVMHTMLKTGETFNPIEMAFSKLKALLRKAEERTIQALWNAIGKLVDGFKPGECANFFKAAGYDAD